MLKSTYKVAPVEKEALPPGWTEHEAPSGHSYYYNSETKQSTYTRPTTVAEAPLQIDFNATQPDYNNFGPIQVSSYESASGFRQIGERGQGHFRGGRSYQDRSRRQLEDRPKSKATITNCEPWILVKTKYGRRFVHNAETKESFWKFPQHVMLAVIEMDRLEWEEKKKKETGQGVPSSAKADTLADGNGSSSRIVDKSEGQHEDDSDSYEEVEVTDDEDEGGDSSSKRQRTGDDVPTGPVEFNENDIAYQLAQMGEDYGLDPGEYDNPDEDYENGEDGLQLSDQAAASLFQNLLDDSQISPYSTFDKLIEDTNIVDDNRYTVLPTMARRREVFSDWSRDRIQRLQEKRSKEQGSKKDPKIAYLRFLGDHASTKLYWPEFKRKFRKEDVMKDVHVSDKEKEKLYREIVAKLKTSEVDRKKELVKLMREVPLSDLNRHTDLAALPGVLERDLRFWAVQGRVRDELLAAHIATLESPPS
jgi:WW domain/FF domain